VPSADCNSEAFRTSRQDSHHSALAPPPRLVYHTLNPHPALSPVPLEIDPSSALQQRQNETLWRQLLVQGVLSVLLPTEDLENGCLRALVAEIFSEMILGGAISEKACEGWLLWESITKMAEVIQPRLAKEEHAINTESDRPLGRLDQYSPQPTFASEAPRTSVGSAPPSPKGSTVAAMFWLVVQYIFLAYHVLRVVIVGLVTSPSLPPRTTPFSPIGREPPGSTMHEGKASSGLESRRVSKRAILSMKLWSCVSLILELEVRMPWFTGCVSLLHWGATAGPGRVGDTDGLLDR
jgi:hypothetical protein